MTRSRRLLPALLGLSAALVSTAVATHSALGPLPVAESDALSCLGAHPQVSYETSGSGDGRVLRAVVLGGLPEGCTRAHVQVRVTTSSGAVAADAAAAAGAGRVMRAELPGGVSVGQVRSVTWGAGG